MVTASAIALIVCAAYFLLRGYLVLYCDRHDLLTTLPSRRLSDPLCWSRLVGRLTLLFGGGLLWVGLLALAFPALAREIAIAFSTILLLVWGPLRTALQRYERD